MIHPAKTGDIDRLIAIARAGYATTFVPLLPECDWRPYDEIYFRTRFQRGIAMVTVIEQQGQVAGFGKTTGTHIDMIFIDPALRGAGIGAKLLAALEQQGAASLECFAINAGARRFYERHQWRLADLYRRDFAGASCEFCRYEKP